MKNRGMTDGSCDIEVRTREAAGRGRGEKRTEWRGEPGKGGTDCERGERKNTRKRE